MCKTRLNSLGSILGIDRENIRPRNIYLGEDGIEYIVGYGIDKVFYEVLKEEEIDDRLKEFIIENYSREEIIEYYGLDGNGNYDLSSADIENYFEYIGEYNSYLIYKTS